jgi:hypothetical protein
MGIRSDMQVEGTKRQDVGDKHGSRSAAGPKRSDFLAYKTTGMIPDRTLASDAKYGYNDTALYQLNE